ncbi:hypothetical protein BJ944DRAFT_269535, partial [Cunninghamella echinulata]
MIYKIHKDYSYHFIYDYYLYFNNYHTLSRHTLCHILRYSLHYDLHNFCAIDPL